MSQNGSARKTWSLLEDGLLWKEVIEGTDKEFRDSARILVLQLQEAVKPADALQGMLLDRIASSYFRKQMLLGIESAMRRYQQVKHRVSPKGSTPELRKLSIVAFSSPAQLLSFAENLRFEMFLDQGLHRDLILLEQLRSTTVATKPERKHVGNGVAVPAMIEHQ